MIKKWWTFYFIMKHEDDENLSLDLMLAHAIVKPILEQHEKKLSLWRFHRRSADDNSQHQFSFMFYSDIKVAEKILNAISESPLTIALKQKELIYSDSYHTLLFNHNNFKNRIKDTSDPVWPTSIQKSWPYFAMGLSKMWLDLIDKITFGGFFIDLKNPESGLEQYKDAEETIKKIWEQQGQHIFFHHTSALFGYDPVWITKKIQF